MRTTDKAVRIANWLRFEHGQPAYKPTIEAALGFALTPALIAEGEKSGLFRYQKWATGEGFF